VAVGILFSHTSACLGCLLVQGLNQAGYQCTTEHSLYGTSRGKCTQATVALKPLICDAAYAVFMCRQPPSTRPVPSRPADRVQNCAIECTLCVEKLAYKAEHADGSTGTTSHNVRPTAAQYADAHLYHTSAALGVFINRRCTQQPTRNSTARELLSV
jgi:uncharacterized CHY-type Zn-finger protein